VIVRAVLDANVLVSAAIQRGPSFRIVEAWFANRVFDLIVSEGVLSEVEDVLTRPRLAKWITHDDAVAFVRSIRTTADVVVDPSAIPETLRDSDDDYLVALARKNGADYIVSGDKDLLEWEEQNPPVVTPAAFEKILNTD
jgi:uncharacterized protein